MIFSLLFLAASTGAPLAGPTTDLTGLRDATSALLELDSMSIELSQRLAEIDAAYAYLDGRSAVNPYNWTDGMPRPVLRDRKKALRAAQATVASSIRAAWNAE
jgi:hypothetical protein